VGHTGRLLHKRVAVTGQPSALSCMVSDCNTLLLLSAAGIASYVVSFRHPSHASHSPPPKKLKPRNGPAAPRPPPTLHSIPTTRALVDHQPLCWQHASNAAQHRLLASLARTDTHSCWWHPVIHDKCCCSRPRLTAVLLITPMTQLGPFHTAALQRLHCLPWSSHVSSTRAQPRFLTGNRDALQPARAQRCAHMAGAGLSLKTALCSHGRGRPS
jgi:hypothetical protein